MLSKDTARTRVQVGGATCGRHACDTGPQSLPRVARHFLECCVTSRESCAWSCGAQRRLFRDGAKVSSESSSSSCEEEPLCSVFDTVGICDSWATVHLSRLLPRTRPLPGLLQMQPSCGVLRAIERFKVNSGLLLQ